MGRIGVLALQGAFDAHLAVLQALGHEATPVRYAAQLSALDGLVLPGGESTTMVTLLLEAELWDPLNAWVALGRPVLATCAGLILAATVVQSPSQRSFGWLDLTVTRNGWGRQTESFEATSDIGQLPLVFIRAPRIAAVGRQVEVLDRYRDEPILVRQGTVTAATFHPELTTDQRIHHAVFGDP